MRATLRRALATHLLTQSGNLRPCLLELRLAVSECLLPVGKLSDSVSVTNETHLTVSTYLLTYLWATSA